MPDMGGPRAYAMADLLRGYLPARRARGKHWLMVPVWAPGRQPARSGPAQIWLPSGLWVG